jgi:membrane-associated phospholipid phosphatase
MTVDEDMKEWLGSENQASLNDDFWDIPTRYGIVSYANIFSLGVYATGLATDSDDIRRTGRLLFESISYSGISVMAIRYIFGRSRPYPGNSPTDFNWFETSNEIQSFPSGHTTVAFALSTVLAEEIGGVWARIAFYGLASMTGYARVRNNQHWFSDVVVGAGLGLVTGLHVVRQERLRGQSGSEARLSVFPSANGINLVYRLP